MNPTYVFCTVTFILSIFTIANACKGCVNIDEFNFDKIIPRFEAVFVKFDVAYPYGDKHDVFTNLANEIIDNNDLILGQVSVKDYFNDKENQDFAKKYGINSKADLPALKLFVRGEDEPFSFDKYLPWNEENLKTFIRDHSTIYLGLRGCLESFDKLAIKFSTSNDKEAVLKETEKEANKLLTEREKKIANTYIKFMKKALENSSFIIEEHNRLTKILNKGKVNDKKKEDLLHRSHILKSFSMQSVKTEL